MALSGGPDSTALVRVLDHLGDEFGLDLQVGHFDHGLRPESASEALALADRVRSLGLSFHAGRPARPLRAAHADLRRARYAWLASEATRIGADRIATGHNRDDQQETVLFHVLRGTGNRGLRGIPERRGRVVRPLLSVPAADIRAWLRASGVTALEDPSNRDPRWARARVRDRLLPALEEELGPEVRERLSAIGRAARDVEVLTAEVTSIVLAGADWDGATLDRDRACAWPPPIRAEVLRSAARELGVRLTGGAARTAASRLPSLGSGHALDLGGGLVVERSFGALRIGPPREPPLPGGRLEIPSGIPGRGRVVLGAREFRVRWGVTAPAVSRGTRVALRVPRDHYPLTIRGWESGDRIRTASGTRKLKRLFADARVPAAERHTVPVVADRHGTVWWVTGLSPRAGADGAHEHELIIEIEHA